MTRLPHVTLLLLALLAVPHRSLAQSVPDGAWRALEPSPRYLSTIVFDSKRDRFVMFGGTFGSTTVDEVKTMPAGGGPWASLATVGASPGPRREHCAIYDPIGDRMIVFGGSSDGSPSTWALSFAGTPTWGPISDGGAQPPSRYGCVAAYDPRHQCMLLFGGGGNAGLSAQTWQLPLDGAPLAWGLVGTVGVAPVARLAAMGVYDAVSDRLLVFGGSTETVNLNDVHALSLSGAPTWSALSPAGMPPCPRYYGCAAFDSTGNRLIVFGGAEFLQCSTGQADDLWSLSLGASPEWTRLVSGDPGPVSRGILAASFDPARRQFLISGGALAFVTSKDLLLNDSWLLALEGAPSWHLATSGPEPVTGRWGAISVYDAARDRMLVFGGHGELSNFEIAYRNDVIGLPLGGEAPWSTVSIVGTPPVERRDTAAGMDVPGQRMLLFGGLGMLGDLQDLWQLDCSSTPTWSPIAALGTPPPSRHGHTAIVDEHRRRLIVFGGLGATALNDVWTLSLDGVATWAPLIVSGTPPVERWEHAAVYDRSRDRMLMFGGIGLGGVRFREVWELTLSDPPTWTQLAPTDSGPDVTQGHTVVMDLARDRVIHLGREAWALELAPSPHWTLLAPAGASPSTRLDHVALHDPLRDRMAVFGGEGLDDTELLEFGSVTTPLVDCPAGDVIWTPGKSMDVAYRITNRLGTPQTYDVRLDTERAWPGFPITDTLALGAGETGTMQVLVPVPDTTAVGVNTLSLRASLPSAPLVAGTCAHHIHDATTDALGSLIEAIATPSRVSLAWQIAAGEAATIERRDEGAPWQALGNAVADGLGRIVWQDDAVRPGATYSYRLAFGNGPGRRLAGETLVQVPLGLALALEGFHPNPAVGHIGVAFTLPEATPASLEVMDVAGRVVGRRDVGNLGQGRHVVEFGGVPRAAGIYVIRLRQGGQVRTSRGILVR
jgi:Kelch motif/Galactose oxidase, central domain